ncbi:nuclear transport factor 2 family protein [Agromyces sp. NPDC049794]|uniref:nuclear transport factor 2 family protein n=1 Tax=unclassified Agromyces TaxID=2639701 RepID=UPI003410B6E8
MEVTSDNVVQVVQRLADEAEIKRVLYTYAFHLDGAEPEGMLPLFTNDLYVAYGPSHGAEGRDDYLEVLSNPNTGIAAFFEATSHHVSNTVIDFVDDETAHARSVFIAWHRYRRQRSDGIVYAQYHDVLKRTAEGWKIIRREQKTAGTEDYHAKAHALVMIDRKSQEAESVR